MTLDDGAGRTDGGRSHCMSKGRLHLRGERVFFFQPGEYAPGGRKRAPFMLLLGTNKVGLVGHWVHMFLFSDGHSGPGGSGFEIRPSFCTSK